jgi:hypothetical protein
MQLKPIKPPHAAFTDLGNIFENPVSLDAFVVTDGYSYTRTNSG